jgi:hypothetical protein
VSEKKFVIIYASFVVLSLLANYPGRTNADTLVMVWEAHNVNALDSWNSPFCAFFYGFFGPVFGYPFGGLIAQSLLLLAWPAKVLSTLTSTVSPNEPARILFIFLWVLISCCFIALAGELIKDMIFCSFLSFIFFICGSADSDDALLHIGTERAVALLAAVVAIAVIRPSNVVLVALVGAALAVWCRRSRLPLSRALTVATLALSLSVIGSAAQNWVFGATPGNSYLATVADDIAGISVNDSRDYFSELTGSQPDLTSITKCYSPKQGDPFMWGECKKSADSLRPLGASIVWKWLGLIASHPNAYLIHRWRFATYLLIADNTGTKNIVSVPPLYLTAMNNAEGIAWLRRPDLADRLQFWSPTIAYAPFGNIAGLAIGEGWLKQPLIWCSVLLIGLAWSLYRKPAGNMMSLYLLGVAGLGNVAMIILIAPSDDLRYLYPTWMCALGTIVVMCENILRLEFKR